MIAQLPNRSKRSRKGKSAKMPTPEERLRKLTSGALSSTIRAHGSINGSLIGSASKRIVNQLLAQYPEVAGALKNNKQECLSERLFEGIAPTMEYALDIATGELGSITGHHADSTIVHYAKAGWCKLKWLEDHEEVKAAGMHTISLPRKFVIIKSESR